MTVRGGISLGWMEVSAVELWKNWTGTNCTPKGCHPHRFMASGEILINYASVIGGFCTPVMSRATFLRFTMLTTAAARIKDAMGSSKKRKTITICASASSYKQAIAVAEELNALGFRVLLPFTALKMKKSGNFDVAAYKLWFKDPKQYARKQRLMRGHFQKVRSGDAVLVLNYEKNGIAGYIGGNTLMEMGLAFHYKKPIYILNPVSPKLGFLEEVLGLQPVFLNGKLEKIV